VILYWKSRKRGFSHKENVTKSAIKKPTKSEMASIIIVSTHIKTGNVDSDIVMKKPTKRLNGKTAWLVTKRRAMYCTC